MAFGFSIKLFISTHEFAHFSFSDSLFCAAGESKQLHGVELLAGVKP